MKSYLFHRTSSIGILLGMLMIVVVPGYSADSTDVSQDSSGWNPPRFEQRQADRDRMVDRYIVGNRHIEDPAVAEAMRHVPRHLFVPQNVRSNAYQNRPLPIGKGQTISQPFIVAYMTDLLDLSPDDKVLEVGTGSGYQAAVLSEFTSHVYTIEIIETLGAEAQQRFEELGYSAIHVKIGDGYYGWKKYAPFDAVIVTAAAGHIPPPLLQQLKPGGVMVIPLGGVYEVQTLMKVLKDEEGEVHTEQLMPVMFVPMTGTVREK